MSRQRLTVVLSQAQGKNPAKRALEESIAAALIMEPGLDVSIVPYLYDLDARHTGRLFLESISGDMVVLAWISGLLALAGIAITALGIFMPHLLHLP